MKIKVARLISLNEFQLYLYDKAKKSFVYLKSDKIQNLAKSQIFSLNPQEAARTLEGAHSKNAH